MRPPLSALRYRLTPSLARAYGLAGPRLDLDRVAPVLIMGNQKTGSSAIAGLLAARTHASLAPDVHGAWQMEHALATGALPARAFLQRYRYYFRHKVVKENSLTLAADALLPALPHGQPVFVVRHPLHNLRSILDRLGWPGTPQPPSVLPPIPHAWRAIVDVQTWGVEASNHITALAERWRLTAETALRHRDRALLIRYEDFSADKQGIIDGLADTLGLTARYSIDALLDHSFQPRGTRRGTELGTVFTPETQARVLQICGPAMQALGYDTTG